MYIKNLVTICVQTGNAKAICLCTRITGTKSVGETGIMGLLLPPLNRWCMEQAGRHKEGRGRILGCLSTTAEAMHWAKREPSVCLAPKALLNSVLTLT